MYDKQLYEAYGYHLDEGDQETQRLLRTFNSAKTWEAGQRYVSSIRSGRDGGFDDEDKAITFARDVAMHHVVEILAPRYHEMFVKHFNALTFKDGEFKIPGIGKAEWPLKTGGYKLFRLPVHRDDGRTKWRYGSIQLYFPYEDPSKTIMWSVFTSGLPTGLGKVFITDAKAFFKANFPKWKHKPLYN